MTELSLPGVEKLWEDATTKHGSNVGAGHEKFLVQLNKSAKYGNTALEVKRSSPDTYVVKGADANVAAFCEGWQQLLTAHNDGVSAMRDALGDDDFKSFSPKVFINVSEPVVDIQLVIVLFNPVWSDYDQREANTVSKWWEMFDRDISSLKLSQAVDYWKKHSVFLDLVPILDNVKRGAKKDDPETLAYNMVNAAAQRGVCTKYVMSRLTSYKTQFEANHPGEKFHLMLASGNADSRHKNDAVRGFKEALALSPDWMDSINFYEYPVHPSKFFHGPDQDADAKYKALNTWFAVREATKGLTNTNQWGVVTQQYKTVIKLMACASLFVDGVTAEKELIAATVSEIQATGRTSDVVPRCGLETIVFLLRANTPITEVETALSKQKVNLIGFDGTVFSQFCAELIKVFRDKDYSGLTSALAGKKDVFHVPEVYDQAALLVSKPKP